MVLKSHVQVWLEHRVHVWHCHILLHTCIVVLINYFQMPMWLIGFVLLQHVQCSFQPCPCVISADFCIMHKKCCMWVLQAQSIFCRSKNFQIFFLVPCPDAFLLFKEQIALTVTETKVRLFLVKMEVVSQETWPLPLTLLIAPNKWLNENQQNCW